VIRPDSPLESLTVQSMNAIQNTTCELGANPKGGSVSEQEAGVRRQGSGVRVKAVGRISSALDSTSKRDHNIVIMLIKSDHK